MEMCECGGLYSFCKSFKKGEVIQDIYEHQCACGCHLYVIEGVLWGNWYPIDLDKIK